MKFKNEMQQIARAIEMEKGFAVIQCVYGTYDKIPKEKEFEILDKLHRAKIDISDAIYVVNIGGYIGDSTRSEIEYAKKHGKEVIFHEDNN